jgi:hypothetical protein
VATEAQKSANAANAQKSTGPRTKTGKAASAKNATSHGLTARELIVQPGEQPAYDALVAAHRADLKPSGALQETIFGQLIAAAWNLRRVRTLQVALFDGTVDPLANPELDAQCDRLARYEQRFERALYRAIAELRRLQTDVAAVELAVEESCAPEWRPLISVRQVLAAGHARTCRDIDEARRTVAMIEAEASQFAPLQQDLRDVA